MGQVKRLATDMEIQLAKNESCEHCIWDGVAYWDDGQPIAQWVACDACNWGNE